VPTDNYNSSSKLTSNSAGSYTYDANGNSLSDASGKSYTWDFENRLVQAVVPGTGTIAFKYDPFGRRIQKSGPLGTTNYLYDGPNGIEEVDNSGNVLARYTQGKNIDEPLAQLRSGTTSYYQQDGLGSVTSLSNSADAVSETYTYDSYGKLTASTGTLTNPFQYTAREFDAETGIYEYRARYYDQNVGRFLSEDPIAFKAGINFYKYVSNNPLSWRDPTGLIGWTCVIGNITAGGILGGSGSYVKCWSDCVAGHELVQSLFLLGGGFTPGVLPISTTTDIVTVQDPYSTIEPYSLLGSWYYAGVSVAPVQGWSYSILKIGDAKSTSAVGHPGGIDAGSATAVGGIVLELSSEQRSCCGH
jgi:RHS repeat-associated protein